MVNGYVLHTHLVIWYSYFIHLRILVRLLMANCKDDNNLASEVCIVYNEMDRWVTFIRTGSTLTHTIIIELAIDYNMNKYSMCKMAFWKHIHVCCVHICKCMYVCTWACGGMRAIRVASRPHTVYESGFFFSFSIQLPATQAFSSPLCKYLGEYWSTKSARMLVHKHAHTCVTCAYHIYRCNSVDTVSYSIQTTLDTKKDSTDELVGNGIPWLFPIKNYTVQWS